VAAGLSDGSASTFVLGNDDTVQADDKWEETRLRTGQRYIHMKISERGIFSCTSNGAMRLTPLHKEGDTLLSSLPTRLYDWRLSPNEETFAYGGEEVDLSVWNTEMAFLPRSETESILSRKRKRNDALMRGEIWRAKNIDPKRHPRSPSAHTYNFINLSPTLICNVSSSNWHATWRCTPLRYEIITPTRIRLENR